jgi:hypothetical protein
LYNPWQYLNSKVAVSPACEDETRNTCALGARMSEMIDRVAEAIALAGNGGTWDDWYNEDQKEFHRKRARAAIETMHLPTIDMQRAGFEALEPRPSCNCDEYTIWQAMIDEALK